MLLEREQPRTVHGRFLRRLPQSLQLGAIAATLGQPGRPRRPPLAGAGRGRQHAQRPFGCSPPRARRRARGHAAGELHDAAADQRVAGAAGRRDAAPLHYRRRTRRRLVARRRRGSRRRRRRTAGELDAADTDQRSGRRPAAVRLPLCPPAAAPTRASTPAAKQQGRPRPFRVEAQIRPLQLADDKGGSVRKASERRGRCASHARPRTRSPTGRCGGGGSVGEDPRHLRRANPGPNLSPGPGPGPGPHPGQELSEPQGHSAVARPSSRPSPDPPDGRALAPERAARGGRAAAAPADAAAATRGGAGRRAAAPAAVHDAPMARELSQRPEATAAAVAPPPPPSTPRPTTAARRAPAGGASRCVPQQALNPTHPQPHPNPYPNPNPNPNRSPNRSRNPNQRGLQRLERAGRQRRAAPAAARRQRSIGAALRQQGG